MINQVIKADENRWSKSWEYAFTPDLLLSLVVLPSIYILKDAYKIVEPFTVEVHTTDSDITVRMGFITQRVDRLLIKNIDNIEVTRTPIGRLLGYRTLHLYSAGGYVALPFLNDCSAYTIEDEIDLIVKWVRCLALL